MRIVILGILIYARLSIMGDQRLSLSLTRAAGLRCLGTIRNGGCNLEYRGGKAAAGEASGSDLHGCCVIEIARVHHLQQAQCSGDRKMRGKLFAV